MNYENIIVTIYIKFSNYISDFLTVSIKGFIRIM